MRITVITPSYNQANYLEKTIESVISQTATNFELEYLIFDGGSSDGSLEIIKKYEHELTYWVSEKDKGQSNAINKGLRRATGDIITWLNSDDQFTPHTLEKVASYFQEDPDLWLIHGKTVLFGEHMPEKLFGAKSDYEVPRSLAGLFFPQPSSFFRKELIARYGFLDETLHFGMDYHFFLPIFLNHYSKAVEDVFSKYLYHDESKSLTQQGGFAREYALIFSKLLISLPQKQSERWIREMKKLGCYHPPKERFDIQKQFSDADIEWAFYQNLMNQLIFYYQDIKGENGSNWKQVQKISSYFVKEAPHFVSQNLELQSVYQKSRWLHPSLLQLLRRIKRKG